MVLPGLDGASEPRRAFVERLQSSASTRLFELPPEAGADYDALEARVRAALPVGAAYVLVAESYSGPIAARIAASAPAGLAGVVFVASFIALPRPGLAWTAGPLRALPPISPPSGLVARLLLGRWATPERAAVIAQVLARTPASLIKARLLAVLAADATQAAARIAVPVLALVAVEDLLIPADSSAQLLRSIPHAQRETVEGPHALTLAVPDAVALRVQAFTRALVP